jgi:hypothetical protein
VFELMEMTRDETVEQILTTLALLDEAEDG